MLSLIAKLSSLEYRKNKQPVFTLGDNVGSLKQRLQQQEHRIYPMAVNWFASGRLQMVSDTQVLLDGEPLPISGRLVDNTDSIGLL